LCNKTDPADIAERLGITPFVCIAIAGRIALATCWTDKPWTEAQKRTTRWMRARGYKVQEIADKIGRSYSAVSQWLLRQQKPALSP
jgi:hypothetical protein